jgi:hypothetical protein
VNGREDPFRVHRRQFDSCFVILRRRSLDSPPFPLFERRIIHTGEVELSHQLELPLLEEVLLVSLRIPSNEDARFVVGSGLDSRRNIALRPSVILSQGETLDAALCTTIDAVDDSSSLLH